MLVKIRAQVNKNSTLLSVLWAHLSCVVVVRYVFIFNLLFWESSTVAVALPAAAAAATPSVAPHPTGGQEREKTCAAGSRSCPVLPAPLARHTALALSLLHRSWLSSVLVRRRRRRVPRSLWPAALVRRTGCVI